MTDSPTHATDDSLVVLYTRGDSAAFDQLYARYQERVWRYAFRASGFDNPTAADVCQEIWLRVVRAAPRYRAEGRFDRWLFGIAHNAIMDRHRQHQSNPANASEHATDELPDLAHFVDRFTVVDALESALQHISPAQRSALLLHHVEGYTLAEIAALGETKRETIKSRLRYAVQSLKSALGEDHGPN